MSEELSITLKDFTDRIAMSVNSAPSLRNVWVTAETSDVRRSGHCYLELVEKDPLTGTPLARVRATIWRSMLPRIDAIFAGATGNILGSGMKVMVKLTASFHPAYGLSANITDIDPAYTLGDLVRLRREIIARLRKEGIIDLNRELQWPEVALRIAVISAPGAAGYGDFVHQLLTNTSCLNFRVRLFPALMQGATAASSIIEALEAIAAEEERWDGVVIIRGGGATSDLAAFDNYDLAANIAQFPLPIIIGIGHERDVTVLDEVANMRVKTPTAAAEWLIGRGEAVLARLEQLAGQIYLSASEILTGSREQLARIEATLPHLPGVAIQNARKRLDHLTMVMTQTTTTCLRPEMSRLDVMTERLSTSVSTLIERQRVRLDKMESLVKVLSPEATLARGYSITRVNGHAVSSADEIHPGDTLLTTLSDGSVVSTAN